MWTDHKANVLRYLIRRNLQVTVTHGGQWASSFLYHAWSMLLKKKKVPWLVAVIGCHELAALCTALLNTPSGSDCFAVCSCSVVFAYYIVLYPQSAGDIVTCRKQNQCPLVAFIGNTCSSALYFIMLMEFLLELLHSLPSQPEGSDMYSIWSSLRSQGI